MRLSFNYNINNKDALMNMDTEQRRAARQNQVSVEQIIRDLQRQHDAQDNMASDAVSRAIAYMQQQQQVANGNGGSRQSPHTSGGGGHQGGGNSPPRPRGALPAADNAVRDMLTKKTIDILDDEHARYVAGEESRRDQDFIQWLTDVRSGEYRHIAKMISLTARFAGEMPHQLIAHHAREEIRRRIDDSQYVNYDDQMQEVEIALWNIIHRRQFPALIGNTNNALAHYYLRNHVHPILNDMKEWMEKHETLSTFLLLTVFPTEGAPKFKKRTYADMMHSQADNDSFVELGGTILNVLNEVTEKQNANTVQTANDVLKFANDNLKKVLQLLDSSTGEIGQTFKKELVQILRKLFASLAVSFQQFSAPLAASANYTNISSSSKLKTFYERLKGWLPALATLLGINQWADSNMKAFSKWTYDTLPTFVTSIWKQDAHAFLLPLIKWAVQMTRLQRLLPSPAHLIQSFCNSAHYNVEFREKVIVLLSQYFDTFAGFERKAVDAWTVLVDPGMAGNARMACNDLAMRLPRLRKLTMKHVLNTAKDDSDERNCMFTDYFCGAIAARWRANSVFSAQPYKTKNEQNAVVQALSDANIRLRDYAIEGDLVVFKPRPQPMTLSEMRFGVREKSAIIYD